MKWNRTLNAQTHECKHTDCLKNLSWSPSKLVKSCNKYFIDGFRFHVQKQYSCSLTDVNRLDMQEHQGVVTRAKAKQLKSHKDQIEQEKFQGLNFDVQDFMRKYAKVLNSNSQHDDPLRLIMQELKSLRDEMRDIRRDLTNLSNQQKWVVLTVVSMLLPERAMDHSIALGQPSSTNLQPNQRWKREMVGSPFAQAGKLPPNFDNLLTSALE
ncbi:hypothetical protein M9H77_18240 [Catharanthus roseus]|uniref:Uncharacterized protein n=1 Tax=Catharanthus roseus TaxID=4058 RepID=A0ACC0B6V7_CATRO|nr:hypothetical protein M9H77_18240 [Catharanthus roseus]